jgi:hypothetical protein
VVSVYVVNVIGEEFSGVVNGPLDEVARYTL